MNVFRMPLFLLALVFSMTACVTINVYFPAAAAEKAADRIIKDVYGEQPDKKEPAAGPQSRQAHPAPLAIRALEWVATPAHAAADISISTAAIQRIKSEMKSRHGSLAPYYNSGAVGMTEDGLIVARDLAAVALKDRRHVRQLVADENRDRNALYTEIARANGHPEWEAEIRQTFARRWVANAPSGWYYQQGGQWRTK